MQVIMLETVVAAAPEEVFRLALNVDLHQASMARHQESAVGGVCRGTMVLGDEVVWEARHFGIRWRMAVAITGYEEPLWFRDEMVSGPFRRMRHDHYFDATAEGTRMRDVFEFEAPCGWLGVLVEKLILRRHLSSLLLRRNEEICRWVEGDAELPPPEGSSGSP